MELNSMTPIAFLASLRARSIRVWATPSEDYGWRPMLHPAALLTDADRAALKEHREAILQLVLAEPEGVPITSWAVAQGRRCLLLLASEADRTPALRRVFA